MFHHVSSDRCPRWWLCELGGVATASRWPMAGQHTAAAGGALAQDHHDLGGRAWGTVDWLMHDHYIYIYIYHIIIIIIIIYIYLLWHVGCWSAEWMCLVPPVDHWFILIQHYSTEADLIPSIYLWHVRHTVLNHPKTRGFCHFGDIILPWQIMPGMPGPLKVLGCVR